MLLEIDQQEHELLLDVLTGALRNLREEIYKTDTIEYEERLKERESILKGVVARLGTAEVPGVSG
jgi:tetrahydromethanopterin S-methyltransferase subunit B